MPRIFQEIHDLDFACRLVFLAWLQGVRGMGYLLRIWEHELGKLRSCEMRVEVECYTGRKVEEWPVRFRLEGHSYFVSEVLDQWYGPDHLFSKIRADDGGVYILRHETSVPDGEWELVSFRKGRSSPAFGRGLLFLYGMGPAFGTR